MFFYDPIKTITNISDDYIFSGAYKKDMKPMTFLQQENLTEGLISFLGQYDFTQEELDIVKKTPKSKRNKR